MTLETIVGISAIVGTIIALYRVNNLSVARNVETRTKLLSLEKEMEQMRTDRDTTTENNRNDHALMFQGIKEISKSVSGIEGYLRGKKETK